MKIKRNTKNTSLYEGEQPMALNDFSALKKNRTKSLDKLNAELDKLSSKTYSDPNEGKFWKPPTRQGWVMDLQSCASLACS